MTRTDARNFVACLNNCQPYVPPVVFGQLMGNPICREIEAIANQPDPAEQATGKPNGAGVNPTSV